jgi:hypothetical protein
MNRNQSQFKICLSQIILVLKNLDLYLINSKKNFTTVKTKLKASNLNKKPRNKSKLLVPLIARREILKNLVNQPLTKKEKLPQNWNRYQKNNKIFNTSLNLKGVKVTNIQLPNPLVNLKPLLLHQMLIRSNKLLITEL